VKNIVFLNGLGSVGSLQKAAVMKEKKEETRDDCW